MEQDPGIWLAWVQGKQSTPPPGTGGTQGNISAPTGCAKQQPSLVDRPLPEGQERLVIVAPWQHQIATPLERFGVLTAAFLTRCSGGPNAGGYVLDAGLAGQHEYPAHLVETVQCTKEGGG